jgi:tetratricopeptide (TPR) repeat protein
MSVPLPIINNRYQLINQIGQGGMGVVYRADDRLTGQTVALKRVTVPGQQLQFTSLGKNTDFRLDLAQEFKVLASLRHPYIISVLDYGFDEDRQSYFTMDLLDGAQTILAYGQGQPLDRKLDLLIQMLQALAYLHRRDIIHRDLKPDNVLVIEGQVKVLDFGLAIGREHLGEAGAETVGTVSYMAPEVLLGAPASEAADLYAVGVIAYELFAGRHPFDTQNLDLLLLDIHQTVPDVAALGLEEQLQAILARLLDKSPEDRYASAQKVIGAFAAATGQQVNHETITIRESYLQAARFVGREMELGQLAEALHQIIGPDAPTGSAWLVCGESGVGKSRLLDELRTLALVEGALVLQGQGIEGGGLPYQLWRAPLRRLILSVEPNDMEAGILKEIIPDIEAMLGRSISTVPTLDAGQQRQRLIGTIIRLFLQHRQPSVLIMEDLQWAVESLEPLKPLMVMGRELPLLIIGSYRDDETPDLPAQLPDTHEMKLARLTEAEIAELSAAMLGEAGQRPDVVNLLQRETEGNVFFLVEVVRALAEEAGRLNDIGRMTLPQQVFAGGVEQIIRRRLGHVPTAAQPLLKLAAVAGRQLDLAILQHLADRQEGVLLPAIDLENWLTGCAEAAVLEVQERQWRFAHDKLRETLVADLRGEERPLLHRQVAEAIEAVYPDDDVQALILADHWREAGDQVKELHYARLAMAQRIAVFSFQEAITLGERALTLLLGEATTETVGLDKLLNKAYETLLHNAQVTASDETVHSIAITIYRLGEALYRLGNIPAARTTLTTALNAARRTDDDQTINTILYWLSQVAAFEGNYSQAQRYLESSLSLTRARDDRVTMISTLIGLMDLNWQMGNLEETQAICEEALTQARQIGDARALYILNRLGTVAVVQGDLDRGERLFEDILVQVQKTDDQGLTAGILSNLGEIAEKRDDFVAAQAYFQQSLAILRRTGQQIGIARDLTNLAGGFIRLGDLAEARRHLQEGLSLALRIDAVPLILAAVRTAGWLRLKEGETARGLALIGLALAHPATNSDITRYVDQILADLEVDAADPTIAAQLAAGSELDLEVVAPTELLALLAELGEI